MPISEQKAQIFSLKIKFATLHLFWPSSNLAFLTGNPDVDF